MGNQASCIESNESDGDIILVDEEKNNRAEAKLMHSIKLSKMKSRHFYCDLINEHGKIAAWKSCVIRNKIENLVNESCAYSIELLNGTASVYELQEYYLAAKDIPYEKIDEKKSRIIAQRDPQKLPYTMKFDEKKFLYENMEFGFYAGIATESIFEHNQWLYLVFFDDGHVQYIPSDKIRHVYGGFNWAGIHENATEFYDYYFRVSADETLDLDWHKTEHKLKVELNGNWESAEIEEVSGSLFKVRFLDTNRFEWLYNRSPRIDKIWRTIHKDKNLQKLCPTTTNVTSVIDHDDKEIDNEQLPKKGTKYFSHQCNNTCLAETGIFDLNALLRPLETGWQRIRFDANIVYFSPCGILLSNHLDINDYLRKTKSKLGIDCFTFDENIDCRRLYNSFENGMQILVEDISGGLEQLPIRVIGRENDGLPEPFKYVTHISLTKGVPQFLLNPHREACCDCEDDCIDKSKCACWKFNIQRFDAFSDESIGQPFGYEFKRLIDNKRFPTGIFECHAGCKCSNKCFLRVAQQLLEHRLEIYKTKKCGWGIRCLNDIPEGSFIGCYFGDILPDSVADDRAAVHNDTYFYDLHASVTKPSPSHSKYTKRNQRTGKPKRLPMLNYFPMNVSKAVDPDGNETFLMDAKLSGSFARFFNHSCESNVFEQNVYVDSHDLRFPRLSFFAKHNIQAGEELTIDYGYEPNSIPGRKLYCNCGSQNCQKRLL